MVETQQSKTNFGVIVIVDHFLKESRSYFSPAYTFYCSFKNLQCLISKMNEELILKKRSEGLQLLIKAEDLQELAALSEIIATEARSLNWQNFNFYFSQN